MKVKIIKGTFRKDNKEFMQGAVLDIDDKEAERLIALGMATKEAEDEKIADGENADNIADYEAVAEADEQDEVQSAQTAKKGGKK